MYRGNPCWVPPLLMVEKALLTPGKNPFWEHAERGLFLAFRGDEPVGRIAAIRDRDFIVYHRTPTGYFGFFECLDDPEAARALFAAAEGWLMGRGLKAMIGPLNPSTNNICGFLLEGYDSPPKFMMPYTLPYYHPLVEGCGLRKAKDLLAYRIPVPKEMNPRLEAVAKAVKKRGVSIRRIDMKNFTRELKLVRTIYNEAWKDNWGFVPITEGEIKHMAKELKPLVVPQLAFFAEYQGELAGFYLVLPDYNQVIKRMNGRMGPLQLLIFFLNRKKITDIRLLMAGIMEKFQKKGLDAVLYLESARAARDLGYKDSEISWLLEDNALVIRAAEFMGGTLYKKYRIYEKAL
ncbi:MAG: N-acetyltransferase [Candidatus Aureabacteria bacterium]|nr:N-acetyltransferase [Candidatus Auribacterota bacterium]